MSRRHKRCVNRRAEGESLLVKCARRLVGSERRLAERARRIAECESLVAGREN